MTNARKFERSIKKFVRKHNGCIVGLYLEDVVDLMDAVKINFDPLEKWVFEPLYTFQAKGDYFMAHNYCHNKLFESKGYLLHQVSDSMTSECFMCSESIEIWLLENMKIVTVGNFRIQIAGNEGPYIVNYRYKYKGKGFGLEIDCFLEDILSLL